MSRILKSQYPQLYSFVCKGMELRIDSQGIYVSDKHGYLWADCNRYKSLGCALEALTDYMLDYHSKLDNADDVTISLLDFLKTGNIDGLSKGTPKASVEALLGLPTDYMATGNSQKSHGWYASSPLWKYGELEVYFTPDDLVNYCSFKRLDCISYHHPVRKIKFEMPFEFSDAPNVFDFQKLLDTQAIDSELEIACDREEACARVVCASGLYILFYERVEGDLHSTTIDSINHGATMIEWQRLNRS